MRTVISALLIGGLLASCTTEGPVAGSTPSAIATLPSKTSAVATAGPTSTPTPKLTPNPTFTPSVSVAPRKSTTSPPPPASTSKPPKELVTVTIPASIKGKDRDAAEAAVTSFQRMWIVVDQSRGEPGGNWEGKIREAQTGPSAENLLNALKRYADDGKHTVGRTTVVGTVTSVGLETITIESCVDTSGLDLLNKDGVSVKAPNQKGSYWRFKQVATVKHFEAQSGAWLVFELNSDLEQEC